MGQGLRESLKQGKSVSQVWHHLPALQGEGAQQKNSGLCQHFSLEESCPPALTLILDDSVPFYMSLAWFELLPSAGAQSKQVRVTPYKGLLRAVLEPWLVWLNGLSAGL